MNSVVNYVSVVFKKIKKGSPHGPQLFTSCKIVYTNKYMRFSIISRRKWNLSRLAYPKCIFFSTDIDFPAILSYFYLQTASLQLSPFWHPKHLRKWIVVHIYASLCSEICRVPHIAPSSYVSAVWMCNLPHRSTTGSFMRNFWIYFNGLSAYWHLFA